MKCTNNTPIENTCRTCMGEEEHHSKKLSRSRKTVSIFSVPKSMETEKTIMEILLLTTAQLNIDKDDMLPKILCESCVDRLIKAHEFQQMCLRVEQRFRDIIKEEETPATNHNNNSTDPLNESEVAETIKDLNNILKIEMDEPLIDNAVCSAYDAGAIEDDVINNDDEDQSTDVKFETNKNEWTDSSDVGNDDDASDIESDWEFQSIIKNSKKRVTKNTAKKLKEETTETSSNEQNLKETDDKIGDTPKEMQDTIINANETKTQDEEDEKHFVCDECGNRLKTRKSLKRHKRIHLRPPGGQKPDNQNLKTKYECEYCQKVFQQSSSLKDHLRIHTGEQPYLCSECGKAFKSLSNMKQHFLRHGTDRPYECPDCPKKFPCLSDLASHKAVHNKTKSHVCDVCGAAFVKPYLLKKHKMYHTGEKNHKCDYCDMRFVLADQCRRHMRTHTGEKPYKCKYCERAFAQSNDLIKHLRGHLGDNVYKCDLCPQGFRLQGDLRAHFNTHKNDDEETKLKNLQALKDDEKRLQLKFGIMEGISKNIVQMNPTTIENVCRTCMGEDKHNSRTSPEKRKTISIFNVPESMEKSYATIMELLILTTPQLNIEKDDMLPKILCEYCVEKLVKVHEFQQMSIRVEQSLRDIINQQTIGFYQNINHLKESAVTQTFSDLNSALKIEMDEPLIDPDYIISDCDGMNYNCSSSDDSSEWQPLSNLKNAHENSIDILEEYETKEENQFECDECGKRMKTARNLDRHKLLHLPHPKIDIPDNLNDTLFRTEKPASPNTAKVNNIFDESTYQYECDICGGRLKYLKSLKRHKRMHLNPDFKSTDKSSFKFKCDECGKPIKTTKGLIQHKRMHLLPTKQKEQPKTHPCEFCTKVFRQHRSLKDHLKTHTGETPYLCSECGKGFTTLINMKQHFLRHGTDRPYECPDCPKKFPCSSNLASHRSVHNKTKTHVCDVCGAAFAKPYLLKKHKMYHTGEKKHKCDYCDMRFFLAEQCRRHMRTHTGEKPYKCKYCERAFAQSNDLMKHLRSHLGDNVYKCDLCPQGFRLLGDLRTHFYTHKNDDEETKLKNLQAVKDDDKRLQRFGTLDGQWRIL